MSDKNFKFLNLQRQSPHVIPVKVRREEFREIYEPFEPESASAQSERCLDCGNPYCEWKCPVHNYIPDWLALVAEGRIEEAAELAHETNSLPEMCGRICPQDRLCEGACTLQTGFGAVTIGAVERYIVDTAFEAGWRPDLSKVRPTGRSVGIVGAGPAGLACADVLARNGVATTVYDRYPEIGGLLSFGIPEFKLELEVVRRRRRVFEEMGICFELNTEVGKTVQPNELMQRHDALFLGMGTYRPVTSVIPGLGSAQVYRALDYLIGQTNALHELSMASYPHIDLAGKRVVVLGGGDTAMDCVRTAIRQGAAEVHCVYRRDRQNMPGSQREVEHAMAEGVKFHYQCNPLAVENDDGRVTGMEIQKTELRPEPGSSRLKPFPIEGSQEVIAADAVIVAFGFRPNMPDWVSELAVDLHDDGRVKVNGHDGGGQTSNPRVFAAGDMVLGADLVVTAVAGGREAAQSILNHLDIRSQAAA
ncbi:MAG: glutamate synthase subunit beta [Xanthomonadales bacterium]|nr:glutamate synthase subunit beta [Xanthomonadales bacterium]